MQAWDYGTKQVNQPSFIRILKGQKLEIPADPESATGSAFVSQKILSTFA